MFIHSTNVHPLHQPEDGVEGLVLGLVALPGLQLARLSHPTGQDACSKARSPCTTCKHDNIAHS